jgi:hypothetical protein
VKRKITTLAVGLTMMATPVALPAVAAADTHAPPPHERSSWS